MKKVSEEELIDIVAVFINKNVEPERRQAAYLMLTYYMGRKWVKYLINEVAEVKVRGDYRVKLWDKEVRKKYKHKCAKCNSNDKTHSHHISPWARDPVARVDIKNGILLCINCHALEHEEIKNLIKSGGRKHAKKSE